MNSFQNWAEGQLNSVGLSLNVGFSLAGLPSMQDVECAQKDGGDLSTAVRMASRQSAVALRMR